MRYLTAYVDPKTGRERLGTGANAGCFHRYASVKNVIRFGLRHDTFPAGHYNIYRWPEGSPCSDKPTAITYKEER